MVALLLMMPLLTLYADFVGILGGGVVGVLMLDLSPTLYLQQTIGAINLEHVFGGLFKAGVYGVLVAIAGCSRAATRERLFSKESVITEPADSVVAGSVATLSRVMDRLSQGIAVELRRLGGN